jgi:hypothetical protein
LSKNSLLQKPLNSADDQSISHFRIASSNAKIEEASSSQTIEQQETLPEIKK